METDKKKEFFDKVTDLPEKILKKFWEMSITKKIVAFLVIGWLYKKFKVEMLDTESTDKKDFLSKITDLPEKILSKFWEISLVDKALVFFAIQWLWKEFSDKK